jgi:hypothetical protein
VTAALVGNNGTIIVAAHGEGEGRPALNMPSVAELDVDASRWLLFASLPNLLTSKVYEARRLVIVTTAGLVIAGALLVVMLIANRILEQPGESFDALMPLGLAIPDRPEL